jgi:alpha/beta superfamily hydrolase
MGQKRVVFKAGDLSLEGVLHYREDGSPSESVDRGAIVCHPHPQFGGDMHNNVVVAVARALTEKDFMVLRFNFRGVGASQGVHAGGDKEKEDVVGAIEYLKPMVTKLFLVGYSFGAAVGLPVALENPSVRGWVAIAPPVAFYDLSYLNTCPKPKLLLVGKEDSFCSGQGLNILCDNLREPKNIRLIPETDHFFWGKESVLAQEVVSFLTKL